MEIRYEKLVIATGSNPVKPKWLQGADLGKRFCHPQRQNIIGRDEGKLSKARNIAVIAQALSGGVFG
jgi:NAD(P)H-nitrite reductase large subunit